MLSNPKIVLLFGLGTLGILAILGFEKKLRNDRVLYVLLPLTFVLGIFGLVIRNPVLMQKGGNAADFCWSPFLYVVIYFLLRRLYIRKYGVEPTYYRASWYDPEEKRKQNRMDVFTFIFPLLFAVFAPVLFHAVFKV